MLLSSMKPDQLRLRVIMVDIPFDTSSIVRLNQRGNTTDIDLASGTSLRFTPTKGWTCWDDKTRKVRFPYEAQVFPQVFVG